MLPLLGGCAPPGAYSKVRGAVKKNVMQELGPADHYDVKVSHDNLFRLLKGKVRRVDIHGVNVRPAPGYVLDDVNITARDARFNRHTKTVEGARDAVFTARISEASLAKMIADGGMLQAPVVHIRAHDVLVSGRFASGPVPLPVDAVGVVRLAGPGALEFASTSVRAGGVPVPFPVSKSFDFHKVYKPVILTGVSIAPGNVFVTGTVDWSQLR